MPSLYLAGTRSSFAGDDLQPIALTVFLVRIVQFILLAVVSQYLLVNEPSIQVVPVDGDGFAWTYYAIDASSNSTVEQPSNSTTGGSTGHGGLILDGRCLNWRSLIQKEQQFQIVLRVYLSQSLIHILISVTCEISVFLISSRGTPTQPWKRSGLVPVMFVKLIPMTLLICSISITGLIVFIFASTVEGCYVDLTGSYPTSDPFLNSQSSSVEMQGTIYIESEEWGGASVSVEDEFLNYLHLIFYKDGLFWVLLFLLLSQLSDLFFNLLTVTCRFKKYIWWMYQYFILDNIHHEPIHTQRPTREQLEENDLWWERHCLACCRLSSVLTCFLFGGNRINDKDMIQSGGHIGAVFTDFFDNYGTLDVVTSDVLAGLTMLLYKQKKRRMESLITLRSSLNTTQAERILRLSVKNSGGGEDSSNCWQEVAINESDIIAVQAQLRQVVSQIGGELDQSDHTTTEELQHDEAEDEIGTVRVSNPKFKLEPASIDKTGSAQASPLSSPSPSIARAPPFHVTVHAKQGGNIVDAPVVTPPKKAVAAGVQQAIIEVCDSFGNEDIRDGVVVDATGSLNGYLDGCTFMTSNNINGSPSSSASFHTCESLHSSHERHLPIHAPDQCLSPTLQSPERGSRMASLTYHARTLCSLDWNNVYGTLNVGLGDGSHIENADEDGVLREEAAPAIFQSTIIPTGGNISVREILNTHNTFDRSVVTEMVRFTKHMLAIYTWRLYIYERPGTGLCKLGYHKCMDRSHAPHGAGHPMDGGEVIGENFLNLHRISMMAQVGFDTKEQELVYASFQVGLEEGPYCIIIDHVWKSVVVTIRGSITLEDVVTDLQLAPESLEDLGQEFGFDGKDQYCHRGFLVRSKWIYNDLERHGYIGQLLDDVPSKCHGYRLRIVGHSLGAGCALIVALMLRSKYPNLRCLCYSPPGCMVTKKLALSCKDFLMTYILNYDLVPRLSLETMLRLRNEVLDLIARLKVPKYRILIAFLRRHREDLINDTLEKYLCDRDNVPDSQFKQQLDNFHQAQEARRTERGVRSQIKLFAPGRIIHLVRTSKDEATKSPCRHKCHASCCCCCCGSPKPAYIPKYAKCDDFKEIVVATSMGTDHFPNNLAHAIRELGETFCIDDSVCPSDESLIPSSSHDSLAD